MAWRERIEGLYRRAAENPGTIALGGGFPAPHLFPSDALANSSQRVLHALGDQVLQYDWPEGREDLRAWIATRLTQRGLAVAPEELLVTSGAQQALSIAAEVLLAPGQRIDVDAATYPGALEIFESRGAKPLAYSRPGARALYRMPGLANPTGAVLSADGRKALLAQELPLIEDEAYAELQFAGPPGPPLAAEARDRVWLIGSFSKTLSPGLRVGWLVPPPAAFAQALELKKLQDIQSNGVTQALLMDFLARDDFEARLAHARRYYRAQAERLVEAVRRELPEWTFEVPQGGFSLWLTAPEGGDGVDLLETALAHGVTFDPGRLFQPSGRSRRLALRLCFSGVPAEALGEGARRLAIAWRSYRGRS
ncbi:MAG TPA: PLP-dependent aminotransferase family protein [Oscillatoriaceae cyanobacterium]